MLFIISKQEFKDVSPQNLPDAQQIKNSELLFDQMKNIMSRPTFWVENSLMHRTLLALIYILPVLPQNTLDKREVIIGLSQKYRELAFPSNFDESTDFLTPQLIL
mgnify:CR=1 FL=1